MLKAEPMPRSARPWLPGRLRRYSAAEVEANNAYRRVFLDMPSWSSWIEDTLRELLEVPDGSELHVTLRNELEGDQESALVFTQREISIGRAPENDISLPLQSVSRHHARIFERGGDLFVEDLRSVSGTYVNRRRLDPAHPCRLSAGDEVLMFPYVLRVEPRELWRPDETVRMTCSCSRVLLDAAGFAARFGPESCLFEVGVHPEAGGLILAISRPLVETIVARLVRSVEIRLVDSDQELVEFIAACVLERANRVLRLPFECSLAHRAPAPAPTPNPVPRPAPNPDQNQDQNQNHDEDQGPAAAPRADARGLILEAYLRLSDARGCLRVFVPGRLLEGAPQRRESLPGWIKSSLRWRLALHAGFVDLESGEIGQLEPGDILLYTPVCDLLLPAGESGGGARRGWRITRDGSDSHRLSVEHFHEWSAEMPAEDNKLRETGAGMGAPDLSALPVRLDVVIGHVDMDLSGLESLASGSIIDLAAGSTGGVKLVAGETVLGLGELVELEDERLGVRITRWREQ